MSDLNYAFAVARIRVLEKSLLSNSDVEQMIALPDAERAADFLRERGWGGPDSEGDPDRMLSEESAKTWALMRELKIGPEILSILAYPDMYHNLKAAIKVVCTKDEHPGVFLDNDQLDKEKALEIVREKDWNSLPEHMRQAAQEAYETLLHTRDGQLCDIIVDRAALAAIAAEGEASKEQIIRDWAERFVAIADIKIAARAARTGKNKDFLKRAIAPCRAVDAGRLIQAASSGMEEVIAYLAATRFAGAADALAESPSAFERWCDNELIEAIRPQKRNPFSTGPVVAYLLARQNEIKTARIILTAKANDLPEEAIRDRAREMYG